MMMMGKGGKIPSHFQSQNLARQRETEQLGQNQGLLQNSSQGQDLRNSSVIQKFLEIQAQPNNKRIENELKKI